MWVLAGGEGGALHGVRGGEGTRAIGGGVFVSLCERNNESISYFIYLLFYAGTIDRRSVNPDGDLITWSGSSSKQGA